MAPVHLGNGFNPFFFISIVLKMPGLPLMAASASSANTNPIAPTPAEPMSMLAVHNNLRREIRRIEIG